jgi:hypothetical protein
VFDLACFGGGGGVENLRHEDRNGEVFGNGAEKTALRIGALSTENDMSEVTIYSRAARNFYVRNVEAPLPDLSDGLSENIMASKH